MYLDNQLIDIYPTFSFSGQNTHVLLSILIKHLDHKNVLKEPDMQLDIVEVTTSLSQHAKVESSVAIIAAVSDVVRHLRKSIHCSLDDANLGADVIKWNKSFREAVDECLVQLTHKVALTLHSKFYHFINSKLKFAYISLLFVFPFQIAQ